MFELTGVQIFAKEDAAHRGWDPRFGVWTPQLRQIDESRCEPSPSLLPDLLAAAALPMPPIRVFWRGSQTVGDSLGNVTRESVAALRGLLSPDAVEVGALTERADIKNLAAGGQADLEVQMPGIAPAILPRCLRFFFHEFGYFYQFPVRNQDVLWAPSRFVGNALAKAFVHNRQIVAPHGIDPKLFHSRVRPRAPGGQEKFRFLYVGTTLSRKGIDLVLRAFEAEKAALPQAELWLKLSPTTSGFLWEEARRGGDRIRVIEQSMSSQELASLYGTCDLLLAPSRAEAFHMPVLEAMACGLPVAIPVGSAMQEYCPPQASFTIDAQWVQVPVTGKQIRFLEPSLASLREAMHRAYAQREALAAMGESAAAAARPYTWEAITRMAMVLGWREFSGETTKHA